MIFFGTTFGPILDVGARGQPLQVGEPSLTFYAISDFAALKSSKDACSGCTVFVFFVYGL